MKIPILICILQFTFTISFGQTTLQLKNSKLLPLTIGNYWIYSDSEYPDKLDTLKIVGIKLVDGDTAFLYNSGQVYFESNDSIYDFQSQRNGSSHKCIQYFPSDDEINFRILIGGDVSISRTVSKINGSYLTRIGSCTNCYEFTENVYGGLEHTIICKGIGIVEIESPDKIRLLEEYKAE